MNFILSYLYYPSQIVISKSWKKWKDKAHIDEMKQRKAATESEKAAKEAAALAAMTEEQKEERARALSAATEEQSKKKMQVMTTTLRIFTAAVQRLIMPQ